MRTREKAEREGIILAPSVMIQLFYFARCKVNYEKDFVFLIRTTAQQEKARGNTSKGEMEKY